jgi:uncharacterized protein
MASAELERLNKLFQIDVGLIEIKKRLIQLDPASNQKILDQHRQLLKSKEGAFHVLHGELKDLELSNKQIEDKLKSIEKHLFDGTVVNVKEVDALEAQKKSLKDQSAKNDEKILELWDKLPPVEKEFEDAKSKVAKFESDFEAWKVKAAAAKQEMAVKYKKYQERRPELAKTISTALLNRYESTAKSSNGIGMSLVTRQHTCEECGSKIAERILLLLQEDQVATCEECRRILYYTDGII